MHYIREILLHIFLKQILMHIIFCIRKKHVQQACVFRSKKISYRKCEVTLHCVKSVQIRNFFWSMFFLVHSEYKKIWTRKTPYLDIFHAVSLIPMAKDLLGKSVLKICSKFIGKHPCRSVISAWVFSCKFAAYFQNTFS